MTAASPRRAVHVVAGALMDADGRVLIAQRPLNKHLAGGWEFPGGKLEPGEERLSGLARELQEELGIAITAPRPLIRVRHAYPTREILLDVWVIRRYSGEPRGLDGQALRWCTPAELAQVDLLPADGPIVRVLWLPEKLTQASSPHYRIGGPRADDPRPRGVYCSGAAEAAAAVGAGAEFLVLREAVANDELAALCEVVSVPVYARALKLEAAWKLGASGICEIDD